MSKTKELSLEGLKLNLPKRFRGVVNQDIVDEINHLVEDPDYGEEFKDSVLTYTDILSGKENWSMAKYLEAVKFYSLTAIGHSQVDAYIKVFPDRLEARISRGQGKEEMRGEAARFNGTELVSRIRNQALVPLHLVNQANVQLGINTLVKIATNGKSEIARVNAATALLKELKPPEAQKIEIDMSVREGDAILDLKEQLAEMAEAQLKAVDRGQVTVGQLGALKPKEEVIEVEVDE